MTMQDDITRRTCLWIHDEDADKWDTECSEAHCFFEDGPRENHYRFCPYCGKPIELMENMVESETPEERAKDLQDELDEADMPGGFP
jgi:hypothetical protein